MDVVFENCMFGGLRDKKSRLRVKGFDPRRLALRCLGADSHPPRFTETDGSPVLHAPWGMTRGGGGWDFATADEAEYQPELCDAIADAVSERHGVDDFCVAPQPIVGARQNALKPEVVAKGKRLVAEQVRSRGGPRSRRQFPNTRKSWRWRLPGASWRPGRTSLEDGSRALPTLPTASSWRRQSSSE